MTTRLSRALAAAILLAGSPALAQPSPPPQQPPAADKVDAKALMQTGVRLLEAKDYLGALAIFKDAYTRFPSAKILLNIGTTLKLLDRKAEAANAYQHYLDSPDADAAKKPQVQAEIAELDKAVGYIELTVTPDGAEVHFSGDEWMPAAQAKIYRLTPGAFVLDARKAGYQSAAKSDKIAAGEKQTIQLNLVEIPKQTTTTVASGHTELEVPVEVEQQPRSRFGALAMVHVSVVPKLGSAVLVGGTVDALPQLSVDAAVLLGPGLVSDGMATRPPPSFGGYVGASYAFLDGSLRPRAGVGMTIFSSDGARLNARGAGGVEYVANRNVSVMVDVGAEIAINPEDDIRELAIVPALAVAGRL